MNGPGARPRSASATVLQLPRRKKRVRGYRLSIGNLTDYVSGLVDREDVGVDHEVVVSGRFAIDAKEALQIVASTGVGVCDHSQGLRFIKLFVRSDAPCPSRGRGCDEDAKSRRAWLDRV